MDRKREVLVDVQRKEDVLSAKLDCTIHTKVSVAVFFGEPL